MVSEIKGWKVPCLPRHAVGAALLEDFIHVAGGGAVTGGSIQSRSTRLSRWLRPHTPGGIEIGMAALGSGQGPHRVGLLRPGGSNVCLIAAILGQGGKLRPARAKDEEF